MKEAYMLILNRKRGINSMYRKIILLVGILMLGAFSKEALASESTENMYSGEKEKIEEYLKNEGKGEVNGTYDIDELCKYEETFLIINNYLDNKNIKEAIVDYEEKWYLPYTSGSGENGHIIFEISEDGKVDVYVKTWNCDYYYDMKVREGKYDGIDVKQVKEEHYFDVYRCGFMCAYVKMNDGTEYMIPFIDDNISQWNSLECKKVYSYDEFFEIMYRYYDEPSWEEMMSSDAEDGEMLMGDSTLRDKPLEEGVLLHKNKSSKLSKIYWSIPIGITIIIAIFGVYFYKILRNKRGKVTK